MTTAKPQQSTGQADSADDLIAELARMMAENAQGDRPVSFTTAQLAPASTQPASPQAAAARPAPAIRIPGGDIVPAVPAAQTAPAVIAQPKPQAASPAAVPPTASPLKPYASQLREPSPFLGARPAAAAPTPVPRPAAYVQPPAARPVEAPAFKVHTFTSADAEDDTPSDRPPEGRSDFDFELDLEEIAPPLSVPAAPPQSFDFDFGFGADEPAPPVVAVQPEPEPEAEPELVAESPASFDDDEDREDDDQGDEAFVADDAFSAADDEPANVEAAPAPSDEADDDYDAAPIPHDEPEVDPIAALISAELEARPAPASVPVAATMPMPARVVSMPVAPPATPANSSFSSSRATPPQFAPSVMPRPASPSTGFPQPAQRLSPIGSRPISGPVAVPRQVENDSFAVSPVFGLGAPAAKPSTPARAERDPMDEIESLIGDAVRVDMGNPAPAKEPRLTSPIPAVQVSFAPRRTTPVAPTADVGRAAQTAEEAILAAAAASGGQVSAFSPEDEENEPRAKKSKLPQMPKMPKIRAVRPEKQFDGERRSAFAGARPFIGLGVAVLFLVAAGYGLYTVFGMNGGGDPATAPVLAADASPVKQVPDPVVASAATTPQSVVFDELAGAPATDPIEQLISRDDTANTDVARVVGDQADADAGLANRKVRTVTVRPDGTIISGDDQVAGGEILPVARPDVPALPAGSVDASDLLAGATAQPLSSTPGLTPSAAVAAVASAGLTGLTPAPATGTPLLSYTTPDGQFVPVPMPRLANRSTTPSQIAVAEPVVPAQLTSSQIVEISSGAPRPVTAAVDQPVDLLATTSAPPVPRADVPQAEPQQAALTPAAPAPAPIATSTGGSSAYVQLSSQRSEAVARAAATEIQQRYGQFFGGAQLEIQRADLGERGIYYRVRLPAGSSQQAASICSSIQGQGGDCFVP